VTTSSAQSSADDQVLAIAPQEARTSSGLPLPQSHGELPHPEIPFNTLAVLNALEKCDLDRRQATTVMESLRSLMAARSQQGRQELLSVQELENSAYLFNAALGEVKTEAEVQRKKNIISLRSAVSSLQRESDGLAQIVRDEVNSLNSDIQLDINTAKEETSTSLKSLELDIMDLSNRYTVTLGEVRTEIEGAKWISTRRVMVTLVVVLVGVVGYFSSSSRRSASSSTSPTVEELGILRGQSEESDRESI